MANNKNFFLKILITTINAFVIAKILPGIRIDDFFTAIILAVVLSLLDAFVKPILILFTLPATIFTMGLFLFVINAFIILIGAHFVTSFHVDGFWPAMVFSMLLSFFNSFVHRRAFKSDEQQTQ